jgi:molybdopterin-guanine dinucleotide biosynthesis protein B
MPKETSSKKAIAFTGPSGSGKTTLIEKIAKALVGDRKIAIIKNDPSDKAVFDREGKDSDRFYKTGADVAVVSPTRTTLLSHRYRELDELADIFGGFDLLMVEGLKTLPLPRIAIFRESINEEYLPVISAMAIDDTVDISSCNIPESIAILDLNDVSAIIEWIDKNSMEMKR